MPIGTPACPTDSPEVNTKDGSIYTRLGVERIFLGQEVNDGIANSLVAKCFILILTTIPNLSIFI